MFESWLLFPGNSFVVNDESSQWVPQSTRLKNYLNISRCCTYPVRRGDGKAFSRAGQGCWHFPLNRSSVPPVEPRFAYVVWGIQHVIYYFPTKLGLVAWHASIPIILSRLVKIALPWEPCSNGSWIFLHILLNFTSIEAVGQHSLF